MKNVLNEESLDFLLNCIKVFIRKNGYPPTVRELCDLTGYKSTNTVHGKLNRLQKLGKITCELSKPRTIRVVV